jgi:alpha-glucan,water dikinase
VFWGAIEEAGLSAERLESYERAITMDPVYRPEIVGDMEAYLDLLKSVHSS